MSLDHEGRNVYEKANRKRGNGLDPVPDAAANGGAGGRNGNNARLQRRQRNKR